jgi:hypothetical protein
MKQSILFLTVQLVLVRSDHLHFGSSAIQRQPTDPGCPESSRLFRRESVEDSAKWSCIFWYVLILGSCK